MKRCRQIAMCSAILLAGFTFISPVAAADLSEPGALVRDTVEEIRQTVASNKTKMSVQALDKEVEKIVRPVFDFRTMARGSLGANWKKATASEQTEFVDLFSDMLANAYIAKIRDNIETSNTRITSDRVKGDKAIVRSVIDYEATTASIDYRLKQKKDTWQVYDVTVENISLIRNYRTEFAGVVRKEGISGLIKKLKDKQQ